MDINVKKYTMRNSWEREKAMTQVSLKKNYIMNIILTMSSFIFPIIVFPYVSRVLLPEGTGKVGFATSIISYFGLVAQLGIPTYGIRACAKVRDDKDELSRTVQELLTISIVTCILTYLVFLNLLIAYPKMYAEKKLYLILSVSMVLNSLGMEWLYKALEQYTYIAIRSIFFKIIAFALMIILIRRKEDYVIYGGLTVFAYIRNADLNNFVKICISATFFFLLYVIILCFSKEKVMTYLKDCFIYKIKNNGIEV